MGCDPFTELCIDDGLDYTVISDGFDCDGFDWELAASIVYGLCFTLTGFLPLLTYLISSQFRTWTEYRSDGLNPEYPSDIKKNAWILVSFWPAVFVGIPYGLVWPFAYLSKEV